jgi:hypothetical protein
VRRFNTIVGSFNTVFFNEKLEKSHNNQFVSSLKNLFQSGINLIVLCSSGKAILFNCVRNLFQEQISSISFSKTKDFSFSNFPLISMFSCLSEKKSEK